MARVGYATGSGPTNGPSPRAGPLVRQARTPFRRARTPFRARPWPPGACGTGPPPPPPRPGRTPGPGRRPEPAAPSAAARRSCAVRWRRGWDSDSATGWSGRHRAVWRGTAEWVSRGRRGPTTPPVPQQLGERSPRLLVPARHSVVRHGSSPTLCVHSRRSTPCIGNVPRCADPRDADRSESPVRYRTAEERPTRPHRGAAPLPPLPGGAPACAYAAERLVTGPSPGAREDPGAQRTSPVRVRVAPAGTGHHADEPSTRPGRPSLSGPTRPGSADRPSAAAPAARHPWQRPW